MQKRERDFDVEEPGDAEKARKDQENPLVMAVAYKFAQTEPGEAIDIPTELWENIILSMSPGTFLILTSTSKLFSAIDKNDWIWQQFFKRDFPVDYGYVGEQLPFYAARWRYFYLHTRHRYVLYYEYAFGVGVKQPFADIYDIVSADFANTRIPTNIGGRVLLSEKMPWFMYIAMCFRAYNTAGGIDFSGNPILQKYVKCQQFRQRADVYVLETQFQITFARFLRISPFDVDLDDEDVSQTLAEMYDARDALFQDSDIPILLQDDTSEVVVTRFKHLQRVFRYPCVTSLLRDYDCSNAIAFFGSHSLSVLSLPGFDPTDYGHEVDVRLFTRQYANDPRYEEDIIDPLSDRIIAKKDTIKYLATCVSCLAPNPEQVCSKCQSVAYCGDNCAEKHWTKGGHSKVCK